MERIFYTDISNVKLSDIDLSLITKERIDKASLLSIELKTIQSLIGYLLLRYAFKTLNIDITDYAFSYKNNKPFFEGLNYHFNISHSNNIVMVVVSDQEVGIDCEYVDINRELNGVAKFTLSQDELKEFNKLPDEDKYPYFYTKWVIKEAYFKMKGVGLSKSFNEISNLEYPVSKLSDANNNKYLFSCTSFEYNINRIEFNQINTI